MCKWTLGSKCSESANIFFLELFAPKPSVNGNYLQTTNKQIFQAQIIFSNISQHLFLHLQSVHLIKKHLMYYKKIEEKRFVALFVLAQNGFP